MKDTITKRICDALPATVIELAAMENRTVHQINALLCQLREQGKIRKTSNVVKPVQKRRGPYPHLWERC